ncbi:hypothetical protein DFH27DRAFT_557513 [Peziza echinospora]|nr:hypothetical protein DFH27DRAFT_557513 [Peziza echinospora]
MRYISLAVALLGLSLSFEAGSATPVPGNGGNANSPPYTSHCPAVTVTKTTTQPGRGGKVRTTVVVSTPTKCSTTTTTKTTSTTSTTSTSSSSSSYVWTCIDTSSTSVSSSTTVSPTITATPTACNACQSCAAPPVVRVTKTLDWEDIDGTAASRVPIPDNYKGFSHYNPDQNKVYRSGPAPNSVGTGRQVAYANDGKFGLGAEGFTIEIKSFWILTFLDPAKGINSATVRVSGQYVSTFTVPITADRQFVQINAPLTGSNTAVGFWIEVFAGSTTDGARLPFWLDDFVYVRNLWPASCCQNAGTPVIVDFNDAPGWGGVIQSPYKGFTFDSNWKVGSYGAFPELGQTLDHFIYNQPGVITSTSPFSLTRLTVLINSSVGNIVGKDTHTVVTITGHDQNGQIKEFGWTINSVLWQWDGPYVKLDLGGDWTSDLAHPPTTGYFASSGGFNNIYELRIKVEEVGPEGHLAYQPFSIDSKS